MNEDIDKHIIDQANIEIRHVRSWPTMAMTFYVAFNIGIISLIIGLPKPLFWWMQAVGTIMTLICSYYMVRTLHKCNKTYITYRELQIDLQKRLFEHERNKYSLPDFWFEKKQGWSWLRYPGFLFYVVFVILVTLLVLATIFLININEAATQCFFC